MLNKKNSH